MCVTTALRPSTTAGALAALYLAWVGYAISVQQPFFADGSHFFLKLLEDRWFIYADDFARHHAHYLTQSPVVLLTTLFRVRNLDVLSWAFGMGLYLPHVVGLAVSYVAVRKADARFMLFPVLSLFGISANQAFVIVHESHVTTSLFWPLLMFVLLWEEYDRKHAVLVIAVSLLFIRTYETVAVLGGALLLVLAIQIRSCWPRASTLTRTVWVLLAAILLAGVGIALRSALFPRVPGNRTDFFRSLSLVLRHLPFMVSVAYMAAITLLAMFAPLGRWRWPYVLAVTLLAPLTAFMGLTPVLAPDLMRAELHYHARSLIVVAPLALVVPAILVARRLVIVPEASWARMWGLVVLLAIGQTTWHVLAAGQWNGFRRVFREQLAAHRGPTPFESTALPREREGIQLVRPLVWGWTQPSLSIVWAERRAVETVILNPVDLAVVWQPFDPLDPAQLPALGRYGFSFEGYVESLKQARAHASDGRR